MNIIQHDVAVEKISDTLAQLHYAGKRDSTAFAELTELLQKVMGYSPDQLLSYEEIIQKCNALNVAEQLL